jgi:hypothetical protein
MKKGGMVVAEYEYTQLNTVIARLADWPVAIGYQLLHGEDEPWSIWIDLGYEMDVTAFPPAPTRNASAALPLTKADLIEIIAKDTPNPGPPQQTVLSARLAGIPHMVLLEREPTPTPVRLEPPPTLSVLRPAYPNPFNPLTTLSFDLATRGHVSLKIYAVDGSYVATVHAGVLDGGPHTYSWNGVDHRGKNVASGVYLAELRTPDGTLHTKLNLLK